MVEIVLLDAVGMEPEFFHLPCVVAGLEALRYYLIAHEQPGYVKQASDWDIVAVGTVPQDPHNIMLRQIHIEREALDWLPFDAWSDGMGSFSLTPPALAAMHDFLVGLAEQMPTTSRRNALEHRYFEPVPIDVYTECGIPAGLVERERPLLERDTHLYRYHADTTLTPECRFLELSDWTVPVVRQHPLITATVSVGLQTYTLERIASIQEAYAQYLSKQAENPLLPADMMEGESSLVVSSGALRALVHLLRERLEQVARG